MQRIAVTLQHSKLKSKTTVDSVSPRTDAIHPFVSQLWCIYHSMVVIPIYIIVYINKGGVKTL